MPRNATKVIWLCLLGRGEGANESALEWGLRQSRHFQCCQCSQCGKTNVHDVLVMFEPLSSCGLPP